MSKKILYITTPLYYVNAKPHIGHAYTNILCDTFARYYRFRGEKVFFLTGTDEHGTKIEKAAVGEKKDPKQYVEEMVPQFKKLWELLGIEYDFFIRTTDADHKQVVQNILRDLEAKGEIYKASYVGWYCTPCESFWTGRELKHGKCPDCQREVQELKEENYFFKLSKYQDWLIQHIESHSDFIKPEIRRNEILGFLRNPLEDLCITRPRARLGWGIDYPASKEHVVYVWFDALINYVSAAGFTLSDEKFRSLWPADLHMVGKDILRQHAVYWPIMLKACGIEPPKSVIAHGWWTMAGAKVSKSRGNVVDPAELAKKYGVDALRYFLLHEVTLGLDGAFSEDLLVERYTTDLANDLGNLWFRLASMLEKYFGGKIPEFDLSQPLKPPLLSETFALWSLVDQAMMERCDPRAALDHIWRVVTLANQFVERNQPWSLAKDPSRKGELGSVLGHLAVCVAHMAVLLLSFLPETAREILTRLELRMDYVMKSEEDFLQPLIRPGSAVDRGSPLFPKIEESNSPMASSRS